MSALKVGLVGCGNIARSMHLPAYAKHKDLAEVVAVADINIDRANDTAKSLGISAAYSSVEELLANTDVDYVDVCVWNGFHLDVAAAAARAGKAVLCEKPMSDSLEHSLALEKVIKETGVPFMMAMVTRFSDEVSLLHELVEAGALGDIYCAKTSYSRRRGTPIGWFTDLKKSGGGPVIDIGVHCLDRTWYLMGRPKPVSVSAATYNKIGNFKTRGVSRWTALDAGDGTFDTEDSAMAFIRFENGATLFVECSWAINAPPATYSQICGSLGGATLDPLTIYTENSAGYMTDNKPILEKSNLLVSFEKEIMHFVDCVNTGKKPMAPVEDGINVQRMLAGIYESAKLGREVIL